MTSTPPLPPQSTDFLRRKAWDRALDASGTASLFEARAGRLGGRLNALSFAGFGIPIIVGIVAAIGLPASAVDVVLIVAAALGGIQLVWSLWSLVANWSGKNSHAIQSMMTNRQLAESYTRLATQPPPDVDDLQSALDVIEARDFAQQDSDLANQITRQEKRFGMRCALFSRGKPCAGCTIVPTSLKPTDCGVCGDFPKRWAK
ncbi:mobilome CxxCx(11)CxxC protein [Rhodococcus sp. NBC_00297]|uniref:mobilome CxxCx(11)CxxC protein n=1 Tax=Rhodococcus sp. NBC_00297 TaxID=2976005 RepID=UPI002E2E7868|nr:mobilome CxxCx(11)CxxC protein [Rhodococcus sp. NBC_00297]